MALRGVGRGWPLGDRLESAARAQRQARRSVPAAFSIACRALPGLSCQGTGFTVDGHDASEVFA